MKNKFNMSGRTMFETIAAMAIISMIGASIYKLANSVTDRYKMSRIQTQIYTLQKTINDRFMAEGNYDTQTRHGKGIWDILKDEGLLDSDIKDGKHAFGGSITIGGVRIDGQDNKNENEDENEDENYTEAGRYFIMFGKGSVGSVWTEVCMSLGDMNWLHEGGSNLVKQCYGGCEIDDGDTDSVDEDFGCSCTYKIPADETTLANCNDNASILWIFE